MKRGRPFKVDPNVLLDAVAMYKSKIFNDGKQMERQSLQRCIGVFGGESNKQVCICIYKTKRIGQDEVR